MFDPGLQRQGRAADVPNVPHGWIADVPLIAHYAGMRAASRKMMVGWAAILLLPVVTPIGLIAQMLRRKKTIDRSPEVVDQSKRSSAEPEPFSKIALQNSIEDWDNKDAEDADWFGHDGISGWNQDPDRGRVTEALALRHTDPGQSFQLLLELAEHGSARCMNLVAKRYDIGEGVPADPAKAEDWWRRAYEAGSKWAVLEYGRALKSRGDLDQCEKVYRAGAVGDWAPALYRLAKCRVSKSKSRQTYLEVLPLLEKAAQQGNRMALWELNWNMRKGHFGFHLIPRGYLLLFGLLGNVAGDIIESGIENGDGKSFPSRRG